MLYSHTKHDRTYYIYKIIYIERERLGTWEVYVRCERRHGEPTRPGRDCPGFVILVIRNIYIQQYFETVIYILNVRDWVRGKCT